MTWTQISEYLASGALDVPDDELDIYKHLKALPLPPDAPVEDDEDEIPDLPTVPVGTPLNFKATEILQAAVKAKAEPVVEPFISTMPTDWSPATVPDLKFELGAAPEASTAISNSAIEPATIEELVVALKVPSLQTVMPQKSLGRPDKHDVSNLNIDEYVVYQGTLLSSARVMASLKGKSYEGERKFKAVEENGEIRIVRIK